jgi:hypothetical protein
LNIADVKERFDRELIVNTNYHSYTILALKEPIELLLSLFLKMEFQMILNI